MALVDRERCYVAVNDAGLALFRYRRIDVVGRRAGQTAIGPGSSALDEQWEQLLATNELYGEVVIRHGGGLPVRISYAAHATIVNRRWFALLVALSATVEPDGPELIGTSEPAASSPMTALLTPREREVVHRVALGSTTRQIASDLFLSPATVRAHVRNALTKTNAHTRAQLVAIVLGDALIAEKGPRGD